jgi:CRISPR/Cas system-associated exonuclease Cas4 (RecB family)
MIAVADSVRVHSPAQPNAKPNPIEALMQTVSASRLNCWLNCRLKFYFRYIEKVRKSPTAALHVGTVVHAVLQAWNMARWRKQAFQLQNFKTVFDLGWADQPAKIDWNDEEPNQKSTGWSLLDCYFKETPIKANEMPEAVEVPMETDLSKYGLPTLIGILDLVRAGGRIVDFKTAGKTPNADDAIRLNEVQLSCYSVLYREATGKAEAGRELHHLVKTKTPKVIVTQVGPMNQTQRVRLMKMIESYVEGLAREDFVPSLGTRCAGCEFARECSRWC